MIVIHHNDLDGKCAAAIVKLANPNHDIRFIEADYKDDIDLKKISIGEEVVIVDFSLKPDVMEKLRKITSNVVWIDHHETAASYPYQDLPGLRDFNEKEMAGCGLTWNYYFPDKPMPLVVQLIDDYDKWALKLDDSKVFYEGMKMLKNTSPEIAGWDKMFDDDSLCNEVIENGKIAIKYRDSYCKGLNDSFGFETKLDGIKAWACNQAMFGSGGFGDRFNKYPICIAFIYDGKNYTISLYSETIDVGSIAKKYKGGGHRGSAGMIVEELPFKRINE